MVANDRAAYKMLLPTVRNRILLEMWDFKWLKISYVIDSRQFQMQQEMGPTKQLKQ